MKPFRFPLESLRVLRRQKEQAAQIHYAKALIASEQAAEQLKRASAELTACWERLTRELVAGSVANKLVSTRNWCTVLEIRCNERKAALAEAQRLAEIAFQEMNIAGRDREALDRFFDKSRLAHDREAQREEQKQFDEMAAQLRELPGTLQFAGHENLN